MKIQCVEKYIRQVLASGRYLISRFQHLFSWYEGNVEEFWVDSTSGLKKHYFIGQIFRECATRASGCHYARIGRGSLAGTPTGSR